MFNPERIVRLGDDFLVGLRRESWTDAPVGGWLVDGAGHTIDGPRAWADGQYVLWSTVAANADVALLATAGAPAWVAPLGACARP